MSIIKPLIKNTIIFLIISLVIGSLFVIFQDSPEFKLLLKFFLFPGGLFVIIAALIYNWFDRKMFARMQNRVGPRFWQPLYDFLKLLAKEDITPDGVDKPEFDMIPAIQVILALMVSFFVPVYMYQGLISFEGDIVFVMFLLALIGGTVFLLGWSSNNPYALLGGSRAAVAEVSFEIPFALSLIGPAILSGSLKLANIASSGYSLIDIPLKAFSSGDFSKIIYLLPMVLLFVLAIFSATAILEKVPFDPAHAEVEIVGGWTVELTGKKLLFSHLANEILEFSVAGIIAAVFLGSPGANVFGVMIGNYDVVGYLINILSFIVKTTFVVFCITLMRTLHARIRIDQLVSYFWRYYLPLSILGVFSIVIFIGVI